MILLLLGAASTSQLYSLLGHSLNCSSGFIHTFYQFNGIEKLLLDPGSFAPYVLAQTLLTGQLLTFSVIFVAFTFLYTEYFYYVYSAVECVWNVTSAMITLIQ